MILHLKVCKTSHRQVPYKVLKSPFVYMKNRLSLQYCLTHWGWVMYLCLSKPSHHWSDKGLMPDWYQAIIWNNAVSLLIGLLGTNFSRITIKINSFPFRILDLNMFETGGYFGLSSTSQWHHNECYGISNHWHLDCLIICLFRCRSKKTSKLYVTGLWKGNHRSPVDSPHKGPVMQKMFTFDDMIMTCKASTFFVVIMNKQPSCWWFRMPWFLCDAIVMYQNISGACCTLHWIWTGFDSLWVLDYINGLVKDCGNSSVLTHWGRDKMAAFFQTTSSNGFSWMKIYGFHLGFHWSLFLGFELTIFQHWFR